MGILTKFSKRHYKTIIFNFGFTKVNEAYK